MSKPVVEKARCCANCSSGKDCMFQDAVLCNVNKQYRFKTETCQLFEMM